MESSRLKEAHAQALSDVDNQVEHWKKVKSDYNDLSNLVSTLPDKRSHNVMVPFGPLAFMPGKLIHTNELMVHLGDSWFADVSCKEGLKIIDNRLQAVDKNFEDLDKVLQNIKKKSEFADDLELNNGDEPAFEIKEKVPSNYLHPGKRKRISRVKPQSTDVSQKTKQKTPKESHDVDDAIKSCLNDNELMKRLDEFEREEEEQDQMLLKEANHAQKFETEMVESTSFQAESRKVSWSKKITKGREADSDDSDDAVTSYATIRFNHTPSVRMKQTVDHHSSGEPLEPAIRTPGDIGRIASQSASISDQIKNNEEGKTSIKIKENPKSILKPTSNNTVEKYLAKLGNSSIVKQEVPVAVSASVFERDSQVLVKSEEKLASKKPVSKFKASRKR